jgi:hypothetical protein
MSMTPEKYARTGHKTVRGWLHTADALVITKLAMAQKIDGGACEIGVHQGRLFLLLHLLTRGASVAVDLFDSQAENTDQSGYGSMAALMENVRKFGEPERVRTIQRNSLHVSAKDILEASNGPVRIFSVDGGHTAECTYNDLRLAMECTRDGSLVILDDYFNSAWPAVSEGTVAFMRDNPDRLRPIYIGHNKFIFARGDAAELLSLVQGTSSHVFGHPVTIAHGDSLRSRLARSALWRKIRRR